MELSPQFEFEDESQPISVLNWSKEQIEEDPVVSGSVVEFAFGPSENSYLATSYPHRPQYAAKDDFRKVAKQNIRKDILRKIARLQPRYIMNIAFRPNSDTWFIFYYGTRFAYDAKWKPKKPGREDSVGERLDVWREEIRDQVSSCAFSEDSNTWFMRSTNIELKWFPQIGPKAPATLYDAYSVAVMRTRIRHKKNGEAVEQTKLRAVTFGHNKAWILYSEDTFQWSDGLPKTLLEALKLGNERNWKINKAVLNPCNPTEYVLVYDHGPVYCSFQRDFSGPFQEILEEWSKSMRQWSKFTEHQVDFHWMDPASADIDGNADPAVLIEPEKTAISDDASGSSPKNSLRQLESWEGDHEARPPRQHRYSDQAVTTRPPDHSTRDVPSHSRRSRQEDVLDDEHDISRAHRRDSGLNAGVGARDRRLTDTELQLQELKEEVRRMGLAQQQSSNQQHYMSNQLPYHTQQQTQYQPGYPHEYTYQDQPRPPLTTRPSQPSHHPPGQQAPIQALDLTRTRSATSPEYDDKQPLHYKANDWRSPFAAIPAESRIPSSGQHAGKEDRTEGTKSKLFWGGRKKS